MTEVEELAAFASRSRYEDISDEARAALKTHVLDSLGCAIGALGAEPPKAVRSQIEAFGGNPLCTLVGGGRSAPDRATFYNGALVRYLDFMDSYLARGETCHPSDNLAAVLVAAEYACATGTTFLTALAVAYQVQTRLSDEAPVRDRGFDHTTQGAYAVAAGAARALALGREQTAHAVAMAAVGNVALRVTRTGALSQWKALAYPGMASSAIRAVFLAGRGVTGPLKVFEGNKGYKHSVSGPFILDWSRESLERVTRTILKRYNAEIHAQSVIEGTLELRKRHHIEAAAVVAVDIEIFDVAHRIIGGGEEGDKTVVRTKEEADHSLPYMTAAALCDGALTPAQYAPERIGAGDVQCLLRRVRIRSKARYSARFPDEMGCRVAIAMRDGRRVEIEKRDYKGFHTDPMSFSDVAAKFHQLAAPFCEAKRRHAIVTAVSRLEQLRVRDLTDLLSFRESE